jgi:uncharacterized damage-inducible protein DinB
MDASLARGIRDTIVGLLENEVVSTRRAIAALPNEGRGYRPDPKSRTAWELIVHVALTDVWFADSVVAGKFVWSGPPEVPVAFTDSHAVADWHEQEMAQRFVALRAMTDDALLRETEFFGRRAPAVLWLTIFNNHMVHHRGQLTSYLRAAGGRVPAIYGPSADDA